MCLEISVWGDTDPHCLRAGEVDGTWSSQSSLICHLTTRSPGLPEIWPRKGTTTWSPTLAAAAECSVAHQRQGAMALLEHPVFQGPEVLLAMRVMGPEEWSRAPGRCSSRRPGFLLHVCGILLTFVVKARGRVTVLKMHVHIL